MFQYSGVFNITVKAKEINELLIMGWSAIMTVSVWPARPVLPEPCK